MEKFVVLPLKPSDFIMLRTILFRSLVLILCLTTELSACTVPVFRFALDQWMGKKGESIGDNPVSQEIANRMIAGHSAVWVLINSGDQAADDAIYDRLESRLKFFESVAELPKIDPDDPSSRLGPGPKLAIKFSIIRIDQDHPIVPNLLGPKAGSLSTDEARVAPVFGRGRVLGAWEAGQMDEEGIDEACFYLTGACSCQVKVQNPGWDLPINFDWDKKLRDADVTLSSTEPTQSPQQAEKVNFTPAIAPAMPERNLTPIVAVGIFFAGVALLLKGRKSKSS